MKVAFCTKEIQQIETARNMFSEWRSGELAAEADYYCLQENLFKILKERFYDVIIFINGEMRSEDDCVIRQPALAEMCTRYTAQFNGQRHVINIQDICYFETYDRKTSMIIGKHKIRITARLDREAEKLSVCQFVLVNRWYLVNMLHVRNVSDDKVHMSNGETLYISSGKRKEFMERYQKYVEENFKVI